MALRKIREYGDEILTKKCREVKEMTPRLKELVADMLETMYDAQGVGLAAPQVGVLKRIVVVDLSEEGDEPIVMINPVISVFRQSFFPDGNFSIDNIVKVLSSKSIQQTILNIYLLCHLELQKFYSPLYLLLLSIFLLPYLLLL